MFDTEVDGEEVIQCYCCQLTPEVDGWNGDSNFKTHAEAAAHLLEHRGAGHVVPDYAFAALGRRVDERRVLGGY